MPRIGGCKCEGEVDIGGGLVDSSPEVVRLRNEFRLSLPCDTANDCPVANREGRIMKLPIGDEGGGDEDWLSFLKNLPNIFFVPLVGVASISGRILSGGDSDGLSPEERE